MFYQRQKPSKVILRTFVIGLCLLSLNTYAMGNEPNDLCGTSQVKAELNRQNKQMADQAMDKLQNIAKLLQTKVETERYNNQQLRKLSQKEQATSKDLISKVAIAFTNKSIKSAIGEPTDETYNEDFNATFNEKQARKIAQSYVALVDENQRNSAQAIFKAQTQALMIAQQKLQQARTAINRLHIAIVRAKSYAGSHALLQNAIAKFSAQAPKALEPSQAERERLEFAKSNNKEMVNNKQRPLLSEA